MEENKILSGLEKYDFDETEIKKMMDMKDDRSISRELLSAYIDKDGEFHEFKNYVDGKEEFAVCMRGNSAPETMIIYHNNHVVWKLSYCRKKYKVEISFRHARYTKEWRKYLNEICKLFGLETKKYMKVDKDSVEIKDIKCEKPEGTKFFSRQFVEKIAEIILNIMKDYFDPKIRHDYFRESVLKKEYINTKKTACMEKQWQQKLFHYYKNTQEGFFVYDLEFSQKFPSEDIRNKMKNKGIKNEPDMLAVRFEHGQIKSLVLIEVKSTFSACKGKSGIEKHLEGMLHYSEEPFFIQNRIKEAKNIFNNLLEMGYIDAAYSDSFHDDLEAERLLILTPNVPGKESAVEYYEKNQDAVIDLCRKNRCSLCLIREEDGGIMEEILPYDCEKKKA